MQCKYAGCNEKCFENSNFCILHLELPPNENENEFSQISLLKEEMIKKKLSDGDFNFKGIKLASLNLNRLIIDQDIILSQAVIKRDLNCNQTKINGDVWMDNVKIGGHCSFELSEIKGTVSFFKGQVGGNTNFDKSTIGKYAWFEEFITHGEASFNHAIIGSSISFKKSAIGETVSFYDSQIGGYAWFDNAQIGGNTWFELVNIKGGLSFKNTIFKNLRGKERAFRSAKIIWERLGDREKADYHFYHEMEAKRMQKPFYIKYPELIVQYPFGYGVHPSRLLFTFLSVLIMFGLIYWILKGVSNNELLENIRFSFLTLIIPAYGVINAKTGILGVFIIIEAFIGAFTWPTFIVTFARKYMR